MKTSSKNPPPKAAIPDATEVRKMMRSALLRIGIPVGIGWVVIILIGHRIGYIIGGVLTLLAAGVVIWALRQMSRSSRVADILRQADTSTVSGRKQALEQIDAGMGKGDAAALFAKAQILMHEDPRKALEVLEQIKLEKVMAPVADEARGQRAMIHLLLGEVDRARALADAIELSRHEQLKSRASLAAVIAEAWARSGQGKRANDTLDLFDFENSEISDLRPQLYRARAFATAAVQDVKRMKQALRKIRSINPQLLAGFVQKKVHPLLEREAKQMLMQSGAVPKRMVRPRG